MNAIQFLKTLLKEKVVNPSRRGLLGMGAVAGALAITPTFATEEEIPKRRMIVIFSTGQSNMPANVPFEWSPALNLMQWDFEANLKPSNAVGTGWFHPSGQGVGPSLVAASEIAEANPDAIVLLINIYRGGLGIKNWGPTPPEYNFRQAIDSNVKAALALIGRTDVDYFIFGGCEADANAESQTICSDVNSLLFGWLDKQPWFTQRTMSFIRGMSPWAETSPGNKDYRWRRYSRALKAVASMDPARRAFIDIESLPIGLFDSSGTLPYIHMTGAGYYISGVRMGREILAGVYSPVPKYEPPTYDVGFVNVGNCSISAVSATWKRESDYLLSGRLRLNITATAPGSCDFDFTIPVKTFALPGNVSGMIASANGDAGIVVQSPNRDFLRATFVAKYSGTVAVCVDFSFTLAPSDG